MKKREAKISLKLSMHSFSKLFPIAPTTKLWHTTSKGCSAWVIGGGRHEVLVVATFVSSLEGIIVLLYMRRIVWSNFVIWDLCYNCNFMYTKWSIFYLNTCCTRLTKYFHSINHPCDDRLWVALTSKQDMVWVCERFVCPNNVSANVFKNRCIW